MTPQKTHIKHKRNVCVCVVFGDMYIYVSEAMPSLLIFLSVSPLNQRITFVRMKASCKQWCNVVEQTPSRLRVAAHFVCSIYQSKADSEIYE